MKWLIAALLVTTFAGCIEDTASFSDTPAPEWQAGYSWSYRADGEFTARAEVWIDGASQDSDSDQQPWVGPLGTDRVLTADAGDLYLLAQSTTIDSVAGGPSLEPFGVRKADLAYVLATLMHEDSTPVSVAFDPTPQPTYLEFPLYPGKVWSGEYSGGADSFQQGYRAEAMYTESIGGPLGPTDAIRVVIDWHVLDEATQEHEIKTSLEGEGARDVVVDVDFTATNTIHYAPELQAVARDHVEFHLRFYAAWTSDGTRIEVESSASGDIAATMTQVSLTPAPDPGMTGALQAFVTGSIPSIDASFVPTSAYQLAVDADMSRANAADDSTVQFSSRMAAGSLPSDHAIRMEVHRVGGEVVATEDGTSMAFDPESPGEYLLVATGRNDDGLQAISAIPFTAYYDATVDLTCALVPTSATTCDPIPIPVRPGIDSARFTLDSTTAGAVGVPGTLNIDAPSFHVGAPSSDGTATAIWNDFKPEDLQDWHATWAPNGAPAQEGTLRIELDFESPEPMEAGMELARGLNAPELDILWALL